MMDTELRLQLATMTHSIRSDLQSVDAIFREHKGLAEWLTAVKMATVALGNLVDMEPRTKILYLTNPDLNEHYKRIERAAAFAKYLRNTFVAHQNEGLLRQALKWRPEIRTFLEPGNDGLSTVIDLFILETAINTYVTEGGQHRILEGETDLIYPPDNQRFNSYLEETITGALGYCNLLIQTLIEGHAAPDWSSGLDLARKAGQMDFGFVTKGKR